MSLAIGPGSFPPGVQFAPNGAGPGSLGNAPIAIRTADGQSGVFTPSADPARFTVGRPISVVPGVISPSGGATGSSIDFVRRSQNAAPGTGTTSAPTTSPNAADGQADLSPMVTVTPRSTTPMWMSSALGYFANTSRAVLPLSGAFTNPTNLERARESFNQVSRDVLPTTGAFTGSRNNLLNAVSYFDAATRGLTG